MKKYPALSIYSLIIKAVAFVYLILDIIFFFTDVIKDHSIFNLTLFFAVILLFIYLLASSELIVLLMDLSYNTNETNSLLMQLITMPEKETHNSEKGKIIENRYENVTSLDVTDKLNILSHLHALIKDERKVFYFGKRNIEEINMVISSLAQTHTEGLELLKDYQRIFNADLIVELTNLSPSYETIEQYLTPLINIGLIKGEPPYDIIKHND
jgi:hypothetical protein